MHLIYCRLIGAGAGAVAVVSVAVCACVTGPALARPSVGHHTARCSLPNGEEGGFALPYFATNVSCKNAKPVVYQARLYEPGCNQTSPTGCKVHGFVCRDSRPEDPGLVSPGDIIRCTEGRKAIRFGEPG